MGLGLQSLWGQKADEEWAVSRSLAGARQRPAPGRVLVALQRGTFGALGQPELREASEGSGASPQPHLIGPGLREPSLYVPT